MGHMTVTREELERAIDEIRAQTADPRAGLYGPGSMAWTIDRELTLFLAGGRAALLQLAHPFVAHAVDQHSATRTDPLGRFQRTFQHVYAMTFGDLEHAIASARRIHAVHRRIYGTIDTAVGPFEAGSRYEANDESALFWVHATLVDSAARVFEAVVRPLTSDERERYLRESHRFARLFGIPAALLPPSWDAFTAYNERMWSDLRVSEPAREIAHFLLHPPMPWLAPIAGWYRVMTAGLMPPPLRAPFELAFGTREQRLFKASLATLRATHGALPARLRHAPAYTRALRRVAGDAPPSRLDRWVEGWLERALTASAR